MSTFLKINVLREVSTYPVHNACTEYFVKQKHDVKPIYLKLWYILSSFDEKQHSRNAKIKV